MWVRMWGLWAGPPALPPSSTVVILDREGRPVARCTVERPMRELGIFPRLVAVRPQRRRRRWPAVVGSIRGRDRSAVEVGVEEGADLGEGLVGLGYERFEELGVTLPLEDL